MYMSGGFGEISFLESAAWRGVFIRMRNTYTEERAVIRGERERFEASTRSSKKLLEHRLHRYRLRVRWQQLFCGIPAQSNT